MKACCLLWCNWLWENINCAHLSAVCAGFIQFRTAAQKTTPKWIICGNEPSNLIIKLINFIFNKPICFNCLHQASINVAKYFALRPSRIDKTQHNVVPFPRQKFVFNAFDNFFPIGAKATSQNKAIAHKIAKIANTF